MKTREIAEFLSAELIGDGDKDITRVADLSNASAGTIAFSESGDLTDAGSPSCILMRTKTQPTAERDMIIVDDPKLAFARVAELLHPAEHRPSSIHANSIIDPSAKIDPSAFVGPFCEIGKDSVIGPNAQILAGVKIGSNVHIGSRCIIHSNVVIVAGCTIGENVVLHPGVVIGSDGFGYVRGASRYVKFPQIGTVVIEDDVEIGANSCVDRGALGETRIGAGTKIDNLVQIAHNVKIGKNVVIAAQTGISGSTVIEDDCMIGGQVGMGDHARVLSGAVIGSQAGVLPGKIVRPGVWWGTPVQPLDEYKKQNAHVKAIGRMKDRLKHLEELVQGLLRRP